MAAPLRQGGERAAPRGRTGTVSTDLQRSAASGEGRSETGLRNGWKRATYRQQRLQVLKMRRHRALCELRMFHPGRKQRQKAEGGGGRTRPGARRSGSAVRRCAIPAALGPPLRPRSDGGRTRAALTCGTARFSPEAWRRARHCPRTPTYIAGGSGMTHRGPPPGQGGELGAAGPIASPRRRCAGG